MFQRLIGNTRVRARSFARRVRPLERSRRFFRWMFAPGRVFWRVPLVGLILFLAVGIVARAIPEKTGNEISPSLREVSLLSLSQETSSSEALLLIGDVTALQKADLRTEGGGRVTAIGRRGGDRVVAGDMIAQFENARERAAALQAEGALDAAQAGLSRTLGGSRTETLDILSATRENALRDLASTKESVANALKSLYTSNEDAIHAKIDGAFSNPRTNAPNFMLSTSDSRLEEEIENERPVIETVLAAQRARKESLSASSDLEAELARAQEETRLILDFVDRVLRAANQAIPSTTQNAEVIATHQGGILAAQGTVSGNLQAVSGRMQELDGKATALRVAEANLSQGITPAETEDVAQAEAAVKQARGSYALALANLEKTVIRSPINGVVDALLVDAGDYLAPGTPVASVSNASGIEIKTSVTENDALYLRVGSPATVDDRLSGVVTRIAPGIDPLTKKVDVRIAVDDPEKTLLNGSSVRVSLERSEDGAPVKGGTQARSLPLSAIKLYADRAVVFTVSPDDTLVEHPVLLGPLLGERVIVLSGLDGIFEIVSDARGLRQGQKIALKK